MQLQVILRPLFVRSQRRHLPRAAGMLVLRTGRSTSATTTRITSAPACPGTALPALHSELFGGSTRELMSVPELLRSFHRNRLKRVLDDDYGSVARGAWTRRPLRRRSRRVVPDCRLVSGLHLWIQQYRRVLPLPLRERAGVRGQTACATNAAVPVNKQWVTDANRPDESTELARVPRPDAAGRRAGAAAGGRHGTAWPASAARAPMRCWRARVAEGVARNVGGIVAPALAYGFKSQPKCGGGQHFTGTTSLDAATLIGPCATRCASSLATACASWWSSTDTTRTSGS